MLITIHLNPLYLILVSDDGIHVFDWRILGLCYQALNKPVYEVVLHGKFLME